MNPDILIVEDESKLADLLHDYLVQAQFSTHRIADGLLVERWVRDHPPRLILLDLMLPGKDGMEICKAIRQFSDVPIIMMTARIDEIDRLLGLELGADDYICKPYSPREVVARVKAVLRRLERHPAADIRSGALLLDEDRYLAVLHDEPLHLTAIEFQLLKVLADEPGRIYSRDQLMAQAYRDHRVVSDRTIDSHVKKLRKKISEKFPGREFIHSMYGVGYKYEPPES